MESLTLKRCSLIGIHNSALWVRKANENWGGHGLRWRAGKRNVLRENSSNIWEKSSGRKRRRSGRKSQTRGVKQEFHEGSRWFQPTAAWALRAVGGLSSGVGPGTRRAGGDACELVHKKTSQLQECWQGFSGVEVKPERSEVIIVSSSESGTDEEADGKEEFGESGRRLAQSFPPPILALYILYIEFLINILLSKIRSIIVCGSKCWEIHLWPPGFWLFHIIYDVRTVIVG